MKSYPCVTFGVDSEEPVATRWLWEGMVAPGKLTVLTSLWKSGKTTLLAHLLARRRLGGEFLGLPVSAGGTVVVSEEPPDLWPMRRRRLQLGEELGVVTQPFVGRPSFAEIEQLNADFVGLKQERGVDLVVFDSLAMFLPSSNENSASAMMDGLEPFKSLAAREMAVWLLHHPKKGEPPLGQAARGSGALLASVDIFLEMRHPGGNPFTRRRKLSCWSRYDETPRQMLIELSVDGLRYERLADTSDDFHANWETVGLVLGAADGPLTRQEIRAGWPPGMTKPHDSTLWRWLERAVELGLASRVGKGTRWEAYRYGVGGDGVTG